MSEHKKDTETVLEEMIASGLMDRSPDGNSVRLTEKGLEAAADLVRKMGSDPAHTKKGD